MRFVLQTIIFLLAITGMSAEARKVALVIGNSTYENTSQLANAENDAALIANSARRAEFDTVIIARNLDIKMFRAKLQEFAKQADGADVAMVYYAGHGIEGKGKNWLIPVDAKLETDRDLSFETIDLDLVMETLSGAQTRIAIIDACRNNPYGRKWRSGSRAVSRGLAGLEIDDVLVIYAAAPGQTASDGNGQANSPFATSLAARLPQADVPIQLLGGMIRDDVLAATKGEQRPFVSASITGTPIYLVRDNLNIVAPLPDTAVKDISALNVPRSIGSGPILLTDIRIDCIKLSGFLGLPDDIYFQFSDGQRFPNKKGKAYKMKAGDSLVVEDSFAFDTPVSFRVMEYDSFGGDDVIGTVDLADTIGTHSLTLNGDKSTYKVTYTLTALQ